MQLRWLAAPAALVAALGTALAAPGVPGKRADGPALKLQKQALNPDFNRDIRPILAANCYPCHGQDPSSRQAGLRLDRRADALAARPSGSAIVPGSPAKSGIVSRIYTANADLMMPPPSSQHRLTADQKALISAWVKQGAPYAEHWAFAPLHRPRVPAVKLAGWVKSPIDSFVLARLEAAGLKPNPEADKSTLLRRLSLDLTGLPPTPAERTAFLQDRSAAAYEKAVDRLLASPRYGEHWARMWLDLARYADTQGYEKDGPRTIWRYRDWVIDAFNSDLPYDQFTIQQLAGDLLPGATPSQLLATAFHRNTMTNTEGGVDGEEFRTAAVKDRVDNTGQIWMGLTIGCAKCHSHKYDPITNAEYYRFYALFNQTQDANNYDEYPTELIPNADQAKKLADAAAHVKALRAEFDAPHPETSDAQRQWEAQLASAHTWAFLAAGSAVSRAGAVIKPRPDGALLVSGKHADTDTLSLTYNLAESGLKTLTAIRLEVLKDDSLPNGGPGRDAADQNVVVSEFQAELIGADGRAVPITLSRARADFEQGGWPAMAAIDGRPETGWAYSPQNRMPHAILFDLKSPLPGTGQLRITIQQNYLRLQLGCFRVAFSSVSPDILRPELSDLAALASIPYGRRQPDQQKLLDEAFRKTHAPTEAVWQQLNAAQEAMKALEAQIPRTPITRELGADRQRVTKIHRRGNFLDPGDVVTPGVPEAFGSLPASEPANRLTMAKWLVSRSNPLTPRVAVNRVWARIFGTGIVETEEDFGTQGSPPSNPELLNWLAASWRDDMSWSMKRLCKTIVMSAAYRQSSEVTPLKKRLDPRCVLLSRAPRFRLSAETVRDSALQISGLLSAKMYGPSVMPPQPDGIWKTVYSGLKWQTSPGEDRYRRGLYTFWRRSSPYPAMTTFDAGSGEFCVIRRIRTNTPLQALVTLNDPAFVEAAGALGLHMMQTAGGSREKLAAGLLSALCRSPKPEELVRLNRLFVEALGRFRAKPDTAAALLKAANATLPTGADGCEAAAWITTANVLLNLDETVTRQ